MKTKTKILVAEDEIATAMLLERVLLDGGYQVTVVRDGKAALRALRDEPFDALLTDWMMPEMDGIELIRQVRATLKPVPLIAMISSVDASGTRHYALETGADAFILKPYEPAQVLDYLSACLSQQHQPAPRRAPVSVEPCQERPPCVGVLMAAGSGGFETVRRILEGLPATEDPVSFLVVHHAPPWCIKSYAASLQGQTRLPVQIAQDGAAVATGQIYLAPGGRHLTLTAGSLMLRLTADPPENFVRSAANPLFRSAARALGRSCVAAILTGVGCDGALGADHVRAAGGLVLAQDPATAVVPFMPQNAIDLGIVHQVVPLKDMAAVLAHHTHELCQTLTGRPAASLTPRLATRRDSLSGRVGK